MTFHYSGILSEEVINLFVFVIFVKLLFVCINFIIIFSFVLELMHPDVDETLLPVVNSFDRWGTPVNEAVEVPGFIKPFHEDYVNSDLHFCIPSPAYV